MKSCFLYIGNFPEDYVIKASELTKIWIAEGFIPEEENQTFEKTATGYLDEFVLRCMVQVVDRTKTSKRVKHLRIHDLFRSWCISEAREDGFFRICTSNSDTSSRKIVDARRLTVCKTTLDDKFHDLSYNARAFLGFNYLSAGNFLLRNIGHNFKLLKVIYLKFPEDNEIHNSKLLKDISQLIHLRNITLVSEALTYLPPSIGKLHNLETLNIKNTSILKLPTTLYKIYNLRHLYTRGITIRSAVNWKSRHIQTLDSVSAGSWMLKGFTELLNIRKLSIFGVTQVGVKGLQDSLHKLIHLKSLCLESDGQADPSLFKSFKSHNILTKLVLINWSNVNSKFPQNLISIRLSGCTFEKGVMASLEKLPCLANLNLEDCCIHSEEEFVCSANGFHQLVNLHIGKMCSVLDWRIVRGALPKIEYLMIRSSEWLTMLPDGLAHLKSLQKLEMVDFKGNLERRLRETLEDQHKIPQITYVTLNGTELNQHKWTYGIMHPNEMSVSDDVPIATYYELIGGGRESHIRGTTKVKVINATEAPLVESKYKVALEVMGAAPDGGDRPGVDFVTVLDVSWSSLGVLKSAMKFFIGKLGSSDRLSIVLLSSKLERLCPLRQITENYPIDVETLVNNLTFGHDRNITAGIQMGLQVINGRRFTTGRLAAIILMSDVTPDKYYHSPNQLKLGNIPVYTFGLGEYCDPGALKEISNASMGGTFSHILNSNNLNIAFSQCFTGLFSVAVSDLKLTVRQHSPTIQTISAGDYTQSTDDATGSVTINFGDVYVNELRRLTVDLRLPALSESDYSYVIFEIFVSSADGVLDRPIWVHTYRREE